MKTKNRELTRRSWKKTAHRSIGKEIETKRRRQKKIKEIEIQQQEQDNGS